MFLATFMTVSTKPYRVADVIIGSKSENQDLIPIEPYKSSKPFKPSKQFFSDVVVYPVKVIQPLSYSSINNQLKYESDTNPYTINSQLKGTVNSVPLSGENTSGVQENPQTGTDNEGQGFSETVSYVKPVGFYDQRSSHFDVGGGEGEGKGKKKEIHYHQHKHLHEHEHKQEHLHKHKQGHLHHHKHGHKHGDKHEHQHWNNHDHHHKSEHGHKHEDKHQHVHKGM